MPRKRNKKLGKKSEKRGEERTKKTILKFFFLRMPELCKLMFCIWIRRPQRLWPVNGFMVSFSSNNNIRKTIWCNNNKKEIYLPYIFY